MKKILFLSLVVSLICFGCDKEPETATPEVEVSVDFSLFSSGNMSRATGDDVYSKFFNDYIVTRKLTPENYSLKITNDEGSTLASFTGKWDDDKMVKLPLGKYHISGLSSENSSKVHLTFDEDLEITRNTESIVLKATYDCFLLLFDAENKKDMKYQVSSGYNSVAMPLVDNIYYYFGKYLHSIYSISWLNESNYSNTIYPSKMNFNKGKFYYFDDITGSFNIDPMENGN